MTSAVSATRKITERAAAKINLTLDVFGKRADGYHQLASLVAFASDVADVVTLDCEQQTRVTVEGPFASNIVGDNLVDKTLRHVADAYPQLRLGAVTLQKNLPVAAGIGGGSADAAALLRAIRRANAADDLLPDEMALVDGMAVDWMALAQRLGADVPVCFLNRSAWMTGVGETVVPMERLPTLNAVLVNPRLAMPVNKTARVFHYLDAPAEAAIDAAAPGPFSNADALLAYMAHHGNALDAAASHVAPVIASIKQALMQAEGCAYAAVSGAGPTCFGIFATERDAARAAEAISIVHPTWWVAPTSMS